MSAGTYTIVLPFERETITVVSLGERESYQFDFPTKVEAFEPEVQRDEGGIMFRFEDGRWQFYPWSNISEVRFTPKADRG